MGNTQTIKLQYPIEIDGTDPIGEITMRRVTVGNVQKLDEAHTGAAKDNEGRLTKQSEFDISLLMVSMLSRLSIEQVRAIDMEDFPVVSGVAADFFDNLALSRTTLPDGEAL